MPIDADALERLRKLRRLGLKQGRAGLRPALSPEAGLAPGSSAAARGEVDRLPGEVVETRYGPAWVSTSAYPLVDQPDLGGLISIPAEAFAAAGRDPALLAFSPAGAAYIDTETTGLSLGAGTYTFLIGVGAFEPGPGGGPAFVVRQYFMRDPAEERAQLHLVEEALGRCTGIVSFNGRAFDWPLLQNRFTLAYAPLPLAAAPHLDLLPPSRRVWRTHFGSCSLGELERQVLGVQRTAADVPGWMIPGIYRDYYQTRGGAHAAELMGRVFYHNLVDILSMARLAARLAALFEQPALFDRILALHPLECACLARCYAELEWQEAGEAAFQAALAGGLPDTERGDVLGTYGGWLKRTGRRAEAAEVWETWVTSVVEPDLEPFVELAKHHEWHTGDLAAARSWAAWALRIAQERAAYDQEVVAELQRRLARLERKIAGRGAGDEERQG